MEWGREVPPGGFLLGQDSGPEGVGPAKHVDIPYSYWLSKFEITVGQYADFINTALSAGDLVRSDNSIRANPGVFAGVPATMIYTLGQDIQWSLNKVEVLQGKTNLPVLVNWYGAIAFAQHYGYDLPTDAEWEKAARGPEHDGLSEHQVYPWGNAINGGNANYSGSGHPLFETNGGRTPVGYYNGSQVPLGLDMANAYGLYDIVGNVSEWTRTQYLQSDSYPSTESVNNPIHSLTVATRSLRGGSWAEGPDRLRNYVRTSADQATSYGYFGFRVVRRS